jgi:hypothetical protein
MRDATAFAAPAEDAVEAWPAVDATILVVGVGAAEGSRPAAAALACAGAEPDRASLLIDLARGRTPRPTLVASASARALEERLAAHLPEARVASRGQLCHLALPPDSGGIDGVAGAVAVARGSLAVLHLPPGLLHPVLEEGGVRPSGALLRADLSEDRALTALAARALGERGMRVGVLKRPLGWIASRRALAGILAPSAGGGLPPRLVGRLLAGSPVPSHECYSGLDGTRIDPAGAAKPERGDHASARSGRGVYRHPQRDPRR